MTGIRAARGVLWDLDGTLIDSADLHYRAWRETLLAHGQDHTPEEFAFYFGQRNDLILRSLFGPGLGDDESRRIADEKEERYRGLVREVGLRPLAGALSWLERLKAAGVPQALASSAPPANIAVAVEQLGLMAYLDAAVSAEEVGHGKPDPAIFLEAARRLDVAPERCVVIEDAPAGTEAARRAGMRCVGVLSSHYPELGADLVVSSLEDLSPEALEALFRESREGS
jgi:HAD superfamily hydrolase (TIGR01509 family)